MKKTRLLASILSLTLGLTSFSAAPISISAETDEMSEVMTTTSAESEGLAPIIHDIDTAREKFEKYIEETDIDANIAEEGKYPQYEGKIVIECEPNTDAKAMIFKFADKNMILHELFTTVMRFDTSKTVTYTVSFRFIDEETGENIENIHAKLYRYNNKLEPNEDNPGSYYIIRDNDVEPVLIAEWDSTETPVFTSEPITSYLSQYDYSVITDKLPEGYNFHGRDHVESGYGGTISDGDHEIYLKIRKGEPTPETVDIPIKGTFSMDVRVKEKNRDIPIEGLDCEVYEMNSGEVVAQWNTSDTEIMHIENLEYEFEGNNLKNNKGKRIYLFRVTNLPENYVYEGQRTDYDMLYGKSLSHFTKGTELSATAYLINLSPDVPEIKYTTTAAGQVSTSVTTTTVSTNTTSTDGDITTTAVSASTQEKFEETNFFVVVGTYGAEKYTQLRYYYPQYNGEYTADKVIWKEAPDGLSYGDVFIADGDVSMTKVQAAPNNPAYAMSYYYQLDDGAKLKKVGNCNDIMEKKDLTVTSVMYDGSSHFSIKYKSADRSVYSYGLSTYGSSLSVNPADCEEGDVFTFALYKGNAVLPLSKNSKVNDDADSIGDANCNGRVDMSDAVLIMQSIANPSKYKLTDQGRKNADMGGDGITSGDALAIQKKLLKLD